MLRIAAYCRVSTDSEDQVNSLISQKKYFAEYIERNPLWELIDIYSDEGISGTSTKKRRSFNRMIADAQDKKFDLIVTKEISRFARNTLDSIFYTRKLRELGVGVIFLSDNINTLEPDAELRLTIMSSIAQEESRKTSMRVKWGQKRRMEQGVVFGRDMLGFDVKDGRLFINEDGAEIVRLIFHKFINEDKGAHVIARELREAGIPTAAYMKKWTNTAILRVLRNEKYCGDLVQKKTFTPNYLNHEKKYNHGEEELVIIRSHHEPIVGREIFDKAQRELKRRSPAEAQKAKHSNRYCFSGKIKCGVCGRSFVSRTSTRKDGSVYRAWRCFEGANHGRWHTDAEGLDVGCDSRSINDADLKLIMRQLVKSLPMDKKAVIDDLCRAVRSELETDAKDDRCDKLQARIDALFQRKQALIELYLNKDIARPDYQKLMAKYDCEIAYAEKQRETMSNYALSSQEQAQSIEQTADELRALSCGDVWDDTFYRHILDKIVVRDNYVLDVQLQMLPSPRRFLIFDTTQLRKEQSKAPVPERESTQRHLGTLVGTEELGHLEMVGTIVHQLTRTMSEEEIKKSGFDTYFVDHTAGVFPTFASGTPWTAATIAVKGDVITDLTEDMAAEQKARTTYDNILRLSDDPDVNNVIRFLREREVVHFQRFGEA